MNAATRARSVFTRFKGHPSSYRLDAANFVDQDQRRVTTPATPIPAEAGTPFPNPDGNHGMEG